jgi:hypothetical protein
MINQDGNPDPNGYSYNAQLSENESGRTNRKFYISPPDRPADYWREPLNYIILRYADILLIAAEASFETGDEPSALKYVNLVRDRAYGQGVSPITSTGAQLKQDIHDERRAELAMEGQRFYDLKRWGIAEKTISDFVDYNMNTSSDLYDKGNDKGTLFDVNKHLLFPIPQRQIDLSEGAVVQSPNY